MSHQSSSRDCGGSVPPYNIQTEVYYITSPGRSMKETSKDLPKTGPQSSKQRIYAIK